MSLSPRKPVRLAAGLALVLCALIARGDNTPQTLPLAQDWTTATLIAVNDDWSGVSGITGYRGDGLAGGTGVDPQTILGEGTPVVDVNANQTNPNTFGTGGVTEFAITDPVVALAGSGTARAPYILMSVSTAGKGSIQVAYNLRDIDGSTDNAVQPVALQYRIGATGSFTNVPAAFVADATTGPSLTTLVTPVSVTLPSSCNNQSLVQVRVITTDAVSNDEWVGVDDISITGTDLGSTPILSINDITAPETNGASTTFSFTVSLSAPAPVGGVTFQATTADGTAMTVDGDYSAYNLGGSIAEGQSTTSVDVTVLGDTLPEPNQAFFVNITSIVGADPGDTTGQGTILNDDQVFIHDVQGTGDKSPFVGTTVTVNGIVTGRKSNGFYLQEPDASVDANETTSEGVFVFTSSAPPASALVGNLVQVTGSVAEFVPAQDPLQPPLTEITAPTVSLTSAGNPLPSPILLSDSLPSASGGFDQLERFEGMRVSVNTVKVVAGTGGTVDEPNANTTSNGVFLAVVRGEMDPPRPFRTTGIQDPDLPPSPATIPPIPRFDGNPEIIGVDSDSMGGSTIDVRAGATVSGLIGPLNYTFRRYTIDVEADAELSVSGGVSPVAVSNATASEITVASFNMERFFDTTVGGGDATLTPAAFDRRLTKASAAIRDYLKMPDIIGVQEVENLSTLQALATRINTDAGATNPDYVAFLLEGADPGGIDVGFLIKQAEVSAGVKRVVPVDTETPVFQIDAAARVVNPDTTTTFPLHDRPSLVLKATVNTTSGATYPITVINNHLRSLNSVSDPATGANGWPDAGARVRGKRHQQVVSLANFLNTRQTNDPTENIVMVGDFNAFEFNDGYGHNIATLTGVGFPDNTTVVPGDGADLVEPNLTELQSASPQDRYSYVFDGNVQTLDHVFLTSAVYSSTASQRLEHARINADFAGVDRNGTGPERLSDHDPAVAYLNVPALGDPPVVSLYDRYALSSTEAYLLGSVDDMRSGELLEVGFAYSATSTSPAPGNGDSMTQTASYFGYFETYLSGLQPNTQYHVVAYAKTTAGIGLSSVDAFTTPCSAMEISLSDSADYVLPGASYSLTVAATGAEGGPFTYTFSNYPSGLTAEGGTLSGTIDAGATGEYEISVLIEGAGGCTETVTTDLDVGSVVSPGDVVISEFRVRGLNGSKDEYIELANRTSSDIVVVAADGSDGWSLGRPGDVYAVVPNGTVIPKNGHWLAIGEYLSLCRYRYDTSEGCSIGDERFADAGEGTLKEIPDDSGFGLFMTSEDESYSVETRLDAVAGAFETDELLIETEGQLLAELGESSPSVQTAWVRRQTDTGSLANRDDASDFVFVATDAALYGPSENVQSVLGAPSPEDTDSAIDLLRADLPDTLLYPARGANQQPNRQTVEGVIEFRRTFTNRTGKDIEDLQFKVTNLTTTGSPNSLVTQATLVPTDVPDRDFPTISMSVVPSFLYNPYLGPGEPSQYLYPADNGGLNSILVADYEPEGCQECEIMSAKKSLGDGSSVNVNLGAKILSGGYFLFTVMPQVTFYSECGSSSVRGGVRREGKPCQVR